MKRLQLQQGFTLTELMIVVAIIGLLASIAIPQYLRFSMRSKTTEAVIFLTGIHRAEFAYFAETDTWSVTPIAIWNQIPQHIAFDPGIRPKYYKKYNLIDPLNYGITVPGYYMEIFAVTPGLDSDYSPDVWAISNLPIAMFGGPYTICIESIPCHLIDDVVM